MLVPSFLAVHHTAVLSVGIKIRSIRKTSQRKTASATLLLEMCKYKYIHMCIFLYTHMYGNIHIFMCKVKMVNGSLHSYNS